MSRPEAHGNEYEYYPPTSDQDDSTLWRPGDDPVTDEAPTTPAGPLRGVERLLDGIVDRIEGQPDRDSTASPPPNPDTSSWWTESSSRRYETNDRVRSVRATGGDFISHVPADTYGRVTSTRMGLLGGEYATVEFENGYTEEIKASDIQRTRWWE